MLQFCSKDTRYPKLLNYNTGNTFRPLLLCFELYPAIFYLLRQSASLQSISGCCDIVSSDSLYCGSHGKKIHVVLTVNSFRALVFVPSSRFISS